MKKDEEPTEEAEAVRRKADRARTIILAVTFLLMLLPPLLALLTGALD